VTVDGANTHDMRLVESTLESIPIKRPNPTRVDQNLCGDKGYDYAAVRQTVDEWGYTAHIARVGEDTKKRSPVRGYRARRWVVERTHSWMNRYRRLVIRWEKKVENYLALIHLACAIVAFRAAEVLG
jgi:putative transposase